MKKSYNIIFCDNLKITLKQGKIQLTLYLLFLYKICIDDSLFIKYIDGVNIYPFNTIIQYNDLWTMIHLQKELINRYKYIKHLILTEAQKMTHITPLLILIFWIDVIKFYKSQNEIMR